MIGFLLPWLKLSSTKRIIIRERARSQGTIRRLGKDMSHNLLSGTPQ